MNNPEFNEALDEAFEGIPLVDVTGPDGTVYHFRFGAMVPYAGEEYAVLMELELHVLDMILSVQSLLLFQNY